MSSSSGWISRASKPSLRYQLPGLLAISPERAVALRNAVEIALDRVHEAAGVGLHQQTRTHLGAVGFRQAAIGQPLDDFAVARRLADRTLGGCSAGLGSHRLHVSVESGGTTGARCCGVFFLVSIELVLFVGIGGLGLLQAVDEARQLIKERPIAIELEVERGFDLAVRGIFQAGDERLHLGKLRRPMIRTWRPGHHHPPEPRCLADVRRGSATSGDLASWSRAAASCSSCT